MLFVGFWGFFAQKKYPDLGYLKILSVMTLLLKILHAAFKNFCVPLAGDVFVKAVRNP